ncbi:hypothetical protein LXL04_031839 [Taraxacum kok-saghyz]
MAVGNQQSEDDYNHGLGGSTSSIDGLAIARVSTSTEAGIERVICKDTLWPTNLGLNQLTGRTSKWNSGNRPSTSASQVLQLKFMNGISAPVSTRKNIEGNDDKPLVVALIDQISGQIVTTGSEASSEVEIVALDADCNDPETEYRTDKFSNKIIRNWNGTKKVLQGNTLVKLNEGIVSVNKISFTHNSTWIGKRNCRLGARSVIGSRVKEAITESFIVIDKRNLRYKKHAIPSLRDDVYRLYKINHRSDRYKCLKKSNITTVMDLRALNAINPERLKDILRVHPNEWKIIMDHAQKCKDDKGIYLYRNSRDDQKSDGVVFNESVHLVGVVANSQFLPCDKLSNKKKHLDDAEKVVMSASKEVEVVPFKDESSLINYLQSSSCNPLINLVIPQTNHLITPTNNHLKINIPIGVTTPPTGQTSQSPKRPASEHDDISNYPKKPKDNHRKITLIKPNAVTSPSEEVSDENEYLKYLNLSYNAQKWKTVWCVVGWISIFSRVQNRRQLLQTSEKDMMVVITTSVEHVEI